MTDAELRRKAKAVMVELSKLSSAADRARKAKVTRVSNDLFYAANRAWRELGDVVERGNK